MFHRRKTDELTQTHTQHWRCGDPDSESQAVGAPLHDLPDEPDGSILNPGPPEYELNKLAPSISNELASDPWAHRSAGMRCDTCMWFVEKGGLGHTKLLGRCRRRAPTLGGYPAVFGNDWCGDYKLDETK